MGHETWSMWDDEERGWRFDGEEEWIPDMEVVFSDFLRNHRELARLRHLDVP